jgi:small GTP-binding protein
MGHPKAVWDGGTRAADRARSTVYQMIAAPLKITLVGDAGVGKTTLMNRWMSKGDPIRTIQTVGGASQTKTGSVHGKTYTFQFWDTAGAERVLMCSNASFGR